MAKAYYRLHGKRFLTKESILEAHDIVIREAGGLSGVKSPQAVESIVHKPKTSAGGQ
jgi:hypothetical protein